MFLNEAPEQLQVLENLIRSRNLQQASDQAHKLAGAAANLSVNRLHATTKKIEAECRANNTERLDLLLVDLHNEFQEVEKKIQLFLQESA
jgi:HPt (histidine-containing phosphotransfer) domain-containing protein